MWRHVSEVRVVGAKMLTAARMYLRDVVSTLHSEVAERSPSTFVGRFFKGETCMTRPFQ